MTRKRAFVSLAYPVFLAFVYIRELGRVPDLIHVILICAVVVCVSTGIYLYVPIAERIENWSVAHMLVWMTALLLFVVVTPYHFYSMRYHNPVDHPWAWPLILFAVAIPAIHTACRRLSLLKNS